MPRRLLSLPVETTGAPQRHPSNIRLRRHLDTLRLLLASDAPDDRQFVEYLMLCAQSRLAWARERDRSR
jgi:hypothetical protein